MLRILPWILLTISVGVLLGVSGYGGYTLGDSDGYHRGYTQGSIDGAGSGYNLRNPTYTEVTDFMARDRTDENEYEEGVYTCSDFASDFNNNAEAEGYRCGFVYMEYGGNFGHSIVAFSTKTATGL